MLRVEMIDTHNNDIFSRCAASVVKLCSASAIFAGCDIRDGNYTIRVDGQTMFLVTSGDNTVDRNIGLYRIFQLFLM